MTYILILVISFGSGLTSLNAEFDSKENCNNAIKALKKELSYGEYANAVCVKK